MLPLRATSGSTGWFGIDRRRREHERVVVDELRAAVVVRAERELRLLARGEVEREQLVVAADARQVDDRLAVGRPGRRVVAERVVGDVADFAALEVDDEDVAGGALTRPENATFLPSGLMSGDSGMSTVLSSIRCSILPVTTFWRISVFCFSVRAK